jgi:hypothetical protein
MTERWKDRTEAQNAFIGFGVAFTVSSLIWMGIFWIAVHFFGF